MGLLDDIAEDASSFNGLRCKVAEETEAHPELADDILEAVDSTFPAASVGRVFKKHGINIPTSSISRHRRKDCACRS